MRLSAEEWTRSWYNKDRLIEGEREKENILGGSDIQCKIVGSDRGSRGIQSLTITWEE